MRLLFVSHSLPPRGRPLENVGGMQRVSLDLHDSLLTHRGADVTTLVLRSPWNQRAWRTPVFLGAALREIRRLARSRDVDAILFSSMVTAALVVPLRSVLKRNGIVTASIVNGLDVTTPTWPYPSLVRRTFETLDLALPISRATAAASEARGLARTRCTVVPLGIRLDRFSPEQDHATARERIHTAYADAEATAPRLILCSVGRLVPRKGVAWFVANVMPLLPADVHYLIVGDGPERTRIEDTIRHHDLGARVKLTGAVSDSELEVVYRGSDLFVMPNVPVPGDIEGFGLVMLEAGLCGLPTIASQLEGIADVITEGENGHLVESGSVAEFRAAIMRYYDNPDRLGVASVRARLHTASRFGWAGVTDRYIEVMRELVEGPR
ncbi:MAG: glycosyltransferase family 4 protein [Gemmatimonadaceae bacterium]|nr:glycosyltransferase family 4 protein [Gemmatimonadaceae bacterium]